MSNCMFWKIKTNCSTAYRISATASLWYGICLMTINYSISDKNYTVLLGSMLNLIEKN
jgi:hypothetical protein